MVGNSKSGGHKVSKEHRRVSSEFPGVAGRSSVFRGSPGGSDHEILELELVKSFNPIRREIRVPEYRSRNKRS